ncbi:MAG: DUF2188 domain-containing protein [Acholeplasmataceae bacterium]|nr:MAG: DUF2188 domain-containing protein [Acholeplasmataceae bacterium]
MCFFRKRKERKRQEREARLAAQSPPSTTRPETTKAVEIDKVKPSAPAADKQKNAKPAKYHVSQNKNPRSETYRKWRVRKEGSDKTIKYFDTQKAAIAFAESLADSSGSSIVVHKLDGSIRKQHYDKKK